jgi:hypothetical protein
MTPRRFRRVLPEKADRGVDRLFDRAELVRELTSSRGLNADRFAVYGVVRGQRPMAGRACILLAGLTP